MLYAFCQYFNVQIHILHHYFRISTTRKKIHVILPTYFCIFLYILPISIQKMKVFLLIINVVLQHKKIALYLFKNTRRFFYSIFLSLHFDCKTNIRNPLRYLLMNAVALRSVSGSFQLSLTEASPSPAAQCSAHLKQGNAYLRSIFNHTNNQHTAHRKYFLNQSIPFQD